jgi:hypothetical protein
LKYKSFIRRPSGDARLDAPSGLSVGVTAAAYTASPLSENPACCGRQELFLVPVAATAGTAFPDG